MNGTIRTSEPDQALLRPHTSSWQRDRASGPLLPMEAHKAWSALTIFGWREPVKVAAVTVAWVIALYILYRIGVAL